MYVSTVIEKEMMMKEINKEIYWEADFTKVGVCESCEEQEGVWAINPFVADVEGKDEWMYLCEECHHGLEMDV